MTNPSEPSMLPYDPDKPVIVERCLASDVQRIDMLGMFADITVVVDVLSVVVVLRGYGDQKQLAGLWHEPYANELPLYADLPFLTGQQVATQIPASGRMGMQSVDVSNRLDPARKAYVTLIMPPHIELRFFPDFYGTVDMKGKLARAPRVIRNTHLTFNGEHELVGSPV